MSTLIELALHARRNTLHALTDRASARELREVEAALARIAEGSYGRCVECGGAIGRQRLLACPEGSRCTRCEAFGEPAASEP
jgi:DnaK suppressor protein